MIKILRIVGAFGVRGLLRVVLFSENIQNYNKLYLEDGSVISCRVVKYTERDGAILAIDGVSDRTKAESLRGSFLFINRDDLPETLDNEFYICDLVGKSLNVHGTNKKCRIINVHNFGAGDLIEILLDIENCESNGASFFVPFTKENFQDSDSGDIVISAEAIEKYGKINRK